MTTMSNIMTTMSNRMTPTSNTRTQQVTTITDIRNDLIAVFNGLRDGTMQVKDAVEINNTAGKIINTAKVQLAYAALRGEAPNIPFLNTATTAKAVANHTPSKKLEA